jgi:hypothetical protein
MSLSALAFFYSGSFPRRHITTLLPEHCSIQRELIQAGSQ